MIGSSLGPYRLDRELGAGGMGKVWAATVAGRCPGLDAGTRVALKVVHPHLLETPGFFKRFLREAEIGKAVVHENVVRTFDCDSLTVDGKRADFLVMEYVEGQTLRSLLAELERVPEELCRHIGREVAKGLAAIHAAGVVHRDVKPENVIISRCTAPGHDHVAEQPGAQRRVSEGNVHLNCDHQVKVMDLGVARLQDEALRLSQTGAFVGSIHYAAPECFREGGRHVDGRADLHALGLVLYEMASGVNPYLADDIAQVLRKVLHEEPRRLGDVNPQLSAFFEEAVHTLLSKDPDARFANAAALVAVLEEGEKSSWWSSRARAIRAETKRPLRRIRIPRETAVYGRDAELTLLRARFACASKGDGQVVLLEGEAGIGKSRLVDELVGRLQREGEDLNFLFGSYPPGGAATAAGALSTAFREHVGDAGVAPYLPQTPLLVPAFEALLSGDVAPAGSEPLTPNSITTCFVQALGLLAAERTTVLLVDDLHFASEDSRAMFTALALAVPGHRLLLVGTTRPGIDEKWLTGLTRLPQTSQFAVGRLGPKDLALLLADSFRSEQLATRLGHQIAVKSDGNPFFAFEIIRGLREGQFITQRDDGTWVSTQVIDDIKIPSSILDLVNARVADLTEDERALLDVAACWGFEFDAALVGEVLGHARIPALRSFGQIERQHRLVRSSGRNYVFDHHQVQEALYGSINEQLREEYHAALADALESRTRAADKDPATLDGALCVDLCEHSFKGAQAARALRYLASALTHLEKGYLNDAAARLAERALGVPGLLAGRERAEMLLRRAGRLDILGRRDAERAALDEAQSLADALGEPALRARVLRTLGGHLVELSRLVEAESSLLAALDLARAAGDRSEEAAVELGLGRVCAMRIRRAEGRDHFDRALAIYREAGNRRGEASAEFGLGNVQSSHAEAREYRERALAIYRETGNRRGEAAATGNLAIGFCVLGRWAEARERYERQLALARETGDRAMEAAGLVNLGNTHRFLGEPELARRRFEQSLPLCRAIRARFQEGYGLWGLAELADLEGDLGAARSLAEESLVLRREIGDWSAVAQSLIQVAELRRRMGETDAARGALEEFLRLSRELGGASDVAQALALSACLPGGDAGAAVDALAAAGAGADTVPADVRWLLWRVTGDRTHLTAAKRLLEESIATNPPEYHEAMRTRVRVNREILEACEAEGVA